MIHSLKAGCEINIFRVEFMFNKGEFFGKIKGFGISHV